MSNISMVEAKLPAGFRFHPRDEELVCDYLMKKVTHSDSFLMIDVDLNKCEPWDIPEAACVGGKEWYFYTQRDRKYATGLRTNRATASGYWKATGKDRSILRKGSIVGMRKTLIFYQGRAPKGRKTDWVMHEFRIETPHGPPQISSSKWRTYIGFRGSVEPLEVYLREDWVLCRVFYKMRDQFASKPSIGNCYEDTSSSTLPPLMDSYITFDHRQAQFHTGEYEQVPCFSIFAQNQTNPIFNDVTTTNMEPKLHASNNNVTMFGGTSYSLDPLSCDRKFLKVVLSQLSKIERNPFSNHNLKGSSPSLGEGSSESYLSEVGMPHLWNNY